MKPVFLIAAALVAVCSTSRADLLIYSAPTDPPLRVTLQGKVQVNPGATVSFKHPLGELYFKLADVTYYTVPTLNEQFEKQLVKANQAKSAEQTFQCAIWALKKGMIEKYYKAVDATLTIDSNHEDAKRALSVRDQMKQQLTDPPNLERDLRELGPVSYTHLTLPTILRV